jgi:hypothetical protein
VRDATVLVAGNTAYVGINTSLDDTTRPRMSTTNGNNRPNVTLRNAVGGTMNGATGSPTGTANVQGYTYGTPGTTGSGATSSSFGTTNGTTGTAPGAGMNNNRNYANSTTTPNGNIATPVVPNTIGRNSVTGAYDANRYNPNMDHAVSGDMKTRVATVIRQANPSIQNVYVSANPQLVNRMGAYARNYNTGRANDAGNDLMNALRRIFPAAR